jgi:hypothetical protein
MILSGWSRRPVFRSMTSNESCFGGFAGSSNGPAVTPHRRSRLATALASRGRARFTNMTLTASKRSVGGSSVRDVISRNKPPLRDPLDGPRRVRRRLDARIGWPDPGAPACLSRNMSPASWLTLLPPRARRRLCKCEARTCVYVAAPVAFNARLNSQSNEPAAKRAWGSAPGKGALAQTAARGANDAGAPHALLSRSLAARRITRRRR